MNSEPRILVLTMYSGENEFEACKAALASQNYKNHELVTIENKPNLEAHHTLYKTIMERSSEFDLFLKLDADMVLQGSSALDTILHCYTEVPDVDHMVFAVYDYIPGKLSYGMHLFSSRVKWVLKGDNIFVDPNPTRPGRLRVIWDQIEPVVFHAPDPHPFHAFHFGLHRGIKSFQWGRIKPHPQARGMWKTLLSTWAHFDNTRDVKIGLAMMGAEAARTGKIPESGVEKKSPEALAYFETIKAMSAEEIHAQLAPFWGNQNLRNLYWWILVGTRVIPFSIARRFARFIKDPFGKNKVLFE